MCTLYDQGKLLRTNQLPHDLIAEFSRVTAQMRKVTALRPTDPGVVIARGKETNLRAVTMAWGWQRPGIRIVVNSRDDKLAGAMWSKADRERRCLVPASAFYEWSGEKGRKTKWRFEADDSLPLWIAGLWENHPTAGLCYSIITKLAERPVRDIHDRQPCCLTDDEALDFLDLKRPAARAGTLQLRGFPREGWKQRR